MIKSEKEKLLGLIDNQIAYWSKLKKEIVEPELEIDNFPGKLCQTCGQLFFGGYKCPCGAIKCQHEPDSKKHLFSDEGGNFFMNRCKHCKEFYK